MKRKGCLLWMLCLGGVVGCHTTPSSPPVPAAATSVIVTEVENAGSGDITKATSTSIQPWFARQPLSLKQHVSSECSTVSKKADATWAGTDEGKVCSAVASVCFFGGCQEIAPIKPIGRMN